MKYLLTSITIIIFSWNSLAQEVNPAYKTNSVTFLGLDYSAAIFIGSNGFNDPAALNTLCFSWNSLFISEQKKYNIQKAFNIRTKYNIPVVNKRNEATDFTNRITDKDIALPHLTKNDLPSIINGYPDFDEKGVALVFIVDAYNKPEATAYYHVVFFNMKTKKVLLTYVVTGEAGGAGLRNYWANSYHDAILKAGSKYSSTAEFYRNYTD